MSSVDIEAAVALFLDRYDEAADASLERLATILRQHGASEPEVEANCHWHLQVLARERHACAVQVRQWLNSGLHGCPLRAGHEDGRR